MLEAKNEHILIKNLMKGDATAFDEIYERYHLRVYSFSLRNLKRREDAEGVVQEVFFNLWKDRKKLKEIKDLDAWIFTVCFNLIRKHFRKISREQKYLTQLGNTKDMEDINTISEIEYNDLLVEAEKIIDHLPPRQKHIFLLSKRTGLSNSEISQKLNISKKTVENHLSSAKTFLKKAFIDESLLSILFLLVLHQIVCL
ncbi:MAG: RNA polymerase sigma-70 factor [Bacteroidales bacterium]|nr:RNA polymerase sigma-70 factor [Bacteroidales bacterium]